MSVDGSEESSFSHPSSYSDQRFRLIAGTALRSSRVSGDSENNGRESKTIAHHSLGDTGQPMEGYLSTVFSCSLFQKDICAGKLVIYPNCMHRMLSIEYQKILSVLEETYGRGAFIYVGSSFQCLFPRHPQLFHKIMSELICDMCIFANNKPAILLTVAKNKKQRDNLTSYNLQIKGNLEEWIRETLVEFKVLSVVVTPHDFRSREHFKRIIFNVETQSRTKVLPSTLATVILTMETFFRKLATCKFVQRFSEETVYFSQDFFEEFIELMEEKNTKTVYSKCSDYIMPLACELGYRLALIGHTSIYSRSEEKREFEELRKAQDLSISITYDRNVADEKLEEGDVLLSSWKGDTILFRAGIAAARRTLASAVVNRSKKMLDEEGRNELMDFVCLQMKNAEEQIENSLRRADSKSQIAELESFSTYSLDEEMQTYTVGKPIVAPEAVSRAPTPELLGSSSENGTIEEDLDSQSTDSQTPESSDSRQNVKINEAMYEEYPLGHFDHMTPSQSAQGDEATCISSARLDIPTFGHSEETMHNWILRERVKDQIHLRKWLSTPELNTESNTFGNFSLISTENQPTHRRHRTYPKSFKRRVSKGTHQSKQTPSKQNKIPPEYWLTKLESEQLLNKERFPSHQRYTRQTVIKQQSRQPTEVSEIDNLNEPRPSHYSTNAETRHGNKGTKKTTKPLQDQNRTRGSSALTDSHNTNTSGQRPGPSYQHMDPANTPYITNQDASARRKSTNASRQRPSSSYLHMGPASTSYITNQDASTRDKSSNASEQRPSPSYQHRGPANTSYITKQDISSRDKSTNAREQRPSPSYQHRDPVNTSYITNQDTSTRGKSSNTSEQRPSPSHQHRDPANTSYISNQNKSTRHEISNASEQRSSPSRHHMDPANASYITKQDTSRRHVGFPKHNRIADNEAHIRPKGCHAFVGESHLTDQGEPKALEDSNMNSPILGGLNVIPRGIVKRGSTAFE